MREINEAWETLRNPAARAAYDDSLHSDRGSVDAGLSIVGVGHAYDPTGQQVRSGEWFTAEPEVAEIEPIGDDADDDAKSSSKSRFKTWHLGPLAAGAAVLIVVLTLLVRTNNLDDRPNTVQTRERYAPGSCVLVAPLANGDNQVTEVPCTVANNGKVVSRVPFPQPCPLQTHNIALVSEQVSLCLQR